jgi:malonyl-CoA O-methyltransferase
MSDPLQHVRVEYDRWSKVYDIDGNPLQNIEGPAVSAALGDVRGLKVLDIGCGTGRHAIALARAGGHVTGIDFSDGMLAKARFKPGADLVQFVVHDLHHTWPFADGQFDRLVSGLVLEHVRDLNWFFAESLRVLRPGGRAVFSAMHPAVLLKGTQARYTDPDSGEVSCPGSLPHKMSDFIMAALRAGYEVTDLLEQAPDEAFAARVPRAAKYIGWPLLFVMTLDRPTHDDPRKSK